MIQFIEDKNPKKLRIVGTTPEAIEWLSQLKESSKRIRKGCEHYVIKAFSDWRSGIGCHRKSLKTKLEEAQPKIEKAIKASKADKDTALIVECSAILQNIWHKNFKDCVSIEEADNLYKVTIKCNNLCVSGCGISAKEAKQVAAKHFIKAVKNQKE